jgi:hypothetical protein
MFDPRAIGATVGAAGRRAINPAAFGIATPSRGSATTTQVAPVQPVVETEEQRRARTGVDPGGQGYVSGQVAPSGQAMAALGAPAGAPVGWRDGGSGFRNADIMGPNGVNSDGDWRNGVPTRDAAGNPAQLPIPQPLPGGELTTTRSSALTTGAPPPGAFPGEQLTTTRGALTSNTGTTPGFSPIPGPVQNVVGNVPIVGPLVNGLTTSAAADLGPALGAQRAAFGLSDDLSQERFDYRPGAAASREAVELEKARQDEIRARQIAALGGLSAAAAGTVPSAAELQLREQAGRSVAATLGQARALGGRSAGGAARAGTLAASDILARTNADAAQLRAAEQERARALEIQALTGVRSADVDVAGADATLRDRAFGQNLDAQLRQNELADKHRLALLEAQLAALGHGTAAGVGAVRGATENAASENRLKSGIIDTAGAAFGLKSRK